MAATEKISITITKQMKESLDAHVASGAYASTSEIIREAIRNWQDDKWAVSYTHLDVYKRQPLMPIGLINCANG